MERSASSPWQLAAIEVDLQSAEDFELDFEEDDDDEEDDEDDNEGEEEHEDEDDDEEVSPTERGSLFTNLTNPFETSCAKSPLVPPRHRNASLVLAAL